jgi:glycosyltransferase involved in cell wall biosynthesis
LKKNNNRLNKICYIHTGDFPSNQVHSMQVMRVCEGFHEAGYSISLIGRKTPGNKNFNKDSFFRYYGLDCHFPIKLISFPGFSSRIKPIRILSYFAYSLYAILIARKNQPDIVYTRAPYVAFFASLLRIPFITEEHAPPLNRILKTLLMSYYGSKSHLKSVFISKALLDIYKGMGLLSEKELPTIIAPDAAALSQVMNFNRSSKMESTNRGRLRIGYVGSLIPGRGIELIIELAHAFPDLIFWVIGGEPEQIDFFKSRGGSNIMWRGFIPPGEVPLEFRELDILLMPYQKDTMTHGGVNSTKWMSPLKMFEYMASGVPLIASDLPVLREVLKHERNCLLSAPDNIEEWKGGIEQLANSTDLRFRLGENAQKDITTYYNWKTRAILIFEQDLYIKNYRIAENKLS